MRRNTMEIITTVWWLTWMTSSPAWIFLQRSARDWWRGRETWPLAAAAHQSYHTAECDTSPWNIRHEYAVIKNIYTWENKEVYTYTFRRPSDDMQTIVCWFDIHALWEVNTVVSIYLYQEFMYVVWRKGKFVFVKDKQQWMTWFQGFTFQTHTV